MKLASANNEKETVNIEHSMWMETTEQKINYLVIILTEHGHDTGPTYPQHWVLTVPSATRRKLVLTSCAHCLQDTR